MYESHAPLLLYYSGGLLPVLQEIILFEAIRFLLVSHVRPHPTSPHTFLLCCIFLFPAAVLLAFNRQSRSMFSLSCLNIGSVPIHSELFHVTAATCLSLHITAGETKDERRPGKPSRLAPQPHELHGPAGGTGFKLRCVRSVCVPLSEPTK